MKDIETEIRKRLGDIQALCRGKLSPRDYDAVVNAASKAVLAAKAADRAAARDEGQPRSEEMLFVEKIQVCGNMKRTLIERNVAWSFQPLVGKVVGATYLAEKVKEAIVMAKRLKESHPHCDDCFVHFVSPAFLKIGNHCEVVIHQVKAADRAALRSAKEQEFTQAEVAGAEDKKTHDAAAILSLLQRGEAITPVRAMDMGILRLSARIWDLRAKGWPIETNLVKVGRSRVAEYRLKTI